MKAGPCFSWMKLLIIRTATLSEMERNMPNGQAKAGSYAFAGRTHLPAGKH